MDRSFERRRRLMSRLLGVALVGAGGGAYGCSSDGNTSKGGGVGGDGGTAFNDSFDSTECFAWPQSGNAGAGGLAGFGGMGGSGGAGGLAGFGGMGGVGGAGGAKPVACPSKTEAAMYLNICGNTPTVKTEGVFANGQCCYDVTVSGCGVGRPFVVAGRAATASRKDNASGWTDGANFHPNVMSLSADERAFLAEAWTRDGLLEHASIASFGRFVFELLAVGAPAELVELAHKAALDEVRHARIAFELATAYAGSAIAPGAFPFAGGVVEVSKDLADVAARVVQEGCIGETMASLLAAEQAARATDPAVRAALEVIAEDEARHAELAWRTIAWALGRGETSVRCAITNAFANGLAMGSSFDIALGSEGALEAHGRPAAEVLRAAMARTLGEVIRPIAKAMLDLRHGDRITQAHDTLDNQTMPT